MKTDLDQNNKARWDELEPVTQRMVNDHMTASPFKLAVRPFWKRLLIAPLVWWRHYNVDLEYFKGRRIEAAKWACRWTKLLLFPNLKP